MYMVEKYKTIRAKVQVLLPLLVQLLAWDWAEIWAIVHVDHWHLVFVHLCTIYRAPRIDIELHVLFYHSVALSTYFSQLLLLCWHWYAASQLSRWSVIDVVRKWKMLWPLTGISPLLILYLIVDLCIVWMQSFTSNINLVLCQRMDLCTMQQNENYSTVTEDVFSLHLWL